MEDGSNSAEEGAVGYDASLQSQPSTSLPRQPNDNIYEPICIDPNASSDDIAGGENIYETIEEVRLQQQQHAMNHQSHQQSIEEPIYLDQLSCSSTYGRIGKSSTCNILYMIVVHNFSSNTTPKSQYAGM